MKTIILISLLVLSGCASLTEWNKDVWHMVQDFHPEESAGKEMPVTIWINGGMYFPSTNTAVFCAYPATVDTIEHEYKHAIGIHGGEKAMTLKEYGELQW